MVNKKIYKFEDIRDKVVKAVDTLADPIRQTLSPRGSNVLFEDDMGGQYVTNDGVTIAKNISVSDPIEDAIISVIKHSALRTNAVAGDGTSTTILLAQSLIKDGLKLIDNGWNRMVLKGELENFGTILKEGLYNYKKEVKTDKDLENIAKISSNSDPDIAKNVVRIAKTAGTDGMVFIEPSSKSETEVIEDLGYTVNAGWFAQELVGGSYTVAYNDVAVLITDKRLYYAEEAETIIKTAIRAGYKDLVIVARDFIGKAANFLIANHVKGTINLLLVKDPDVTEKDNTSLGDLAIYLGGKLVTDKAGKLVNNLKKEDFVVAKKVYSNPTRTILLPREKTNPELAMRIASVREELEKNPNDKSLERRLAALTTGTVTVKVGGGTSIEVQERIFRYEDAVNATRAAIKDGYLVGGGLSILRALPEGLDPELAPMFRRYCEAGIRQIAENCGKHADYVLEQTNVSKDIGYNASTDKFENLLKAGVIDPLKVTEMAIDNSISVANVILTSGTLIVNDVNEDDKETKRGDYREQRSSGRADN